jgi:hypothetical protein
MRHRVKYMLIACCIATLATAADAQGTPKTTISGTPPFALGTPVGTVLRANPTLHPTSTACPAQGGAVNPVPTANYETRMTAPLRGYPYIAHVVLCFYGGTLGAIHLEWPADAFRDSVIEWRSQAQGLARQLTSAYAADLIKRNWVDEDFGGRVEIRDAQGNVLTMVADANAGGLDIVLDYVAGAYNQVLNGTATLDGSY